MESKEDTEMPDEVYRFGPFVLNASKRDLHRCGEQGQATHEEVEVVGRPMDLLLYLVRHHGVPIERETVIKEVWEAQVGDNALTQQLKMLRNLLGDDVDSPRFIKTTGDGYVKFICEVESVRQPGIPGDTAE